MDAFISPNQSLHWPLSEVLLQSRLHLSQLGVVAWIGEENSRQFVPVLLKTDRSMKNASPNLLYLGITSSVPLDVLVWRWSARVQSKCQKYGSWEKIKYKGVIPPQKQISLELPNSVNAEICFEVQGQEHESDTWYPLSATIKIPK
jgi:hypothetical protein